MSQSTLSPELLDLGIETGEWMVVIFNNDSNTMDEVMAALMRATGCTVEEAYIEMWEAHTYGKASVHFASKPECEVAADIIARIGVRTEVCREWPSE